MKADLYAGFEELEQYLLGLGMFSMHLGLERMQRALDLLGISPRELPVIHVLGTNGKGSTAFYIQELARESGLRTGLYTSPHLVSLRERVRVNGKDLSPRAWVEEAGVIGYACSELELTYFEFLTLLGYLLFIREKVDVAVLEAGLGGRYDATNVFEPDLTVFTPLALDHCRVLGRSLEDIAADKAGAIKNSPVVSAPQEPGVEKILRRAARKKGMDFFPGHGAGEGNYLDGNYRLAEMAWGVFTAGKGAEFSPVEGGRRKDVLPGRLHRVCRSPQIILDGAHNPHALDSLFHILKESGMCPEIIVFSCFADKDVSGMCAVLEKFECPVLLYPLGEDDRPDGCAEARRMLGDRALLHGDFELLLSQIAGDKRVLVCGSLYLLGLFYSRFPHWMRGGDNMLV